MMRITTHDADGVAHTVLAPVQYTTLSPMLQQFTTTPAWLPHYPGFPEWQKEFMKTLPTGAPTVYPLKNIWASEAAANAARNARMAAQTSMEQALEARRAAEAARQATKDTMNFKVIAERIYDVARQTADVAAKANRIVANQKPPWVH
mmetsp:Transcript_69220/g.184465  ORF Transcript_69220/g.184465 Transcript_69220/m.184465 type:complete len:148 (-) Transcript_69220:34-477(-)